MILSLRLQDENIIRNFSLGKYIIDNVSHNKQEAKITGIDYHYLFNTKFPINAFTRKEYPFLQNEFIDKIKPEMIGIGNGVLGIYKFLVTSSSPSSKKYLLCIG